MGLSTHRKPTRLEMNSSMADWVCLDAISSVLGCSHVEFFDLIDRGAQSCL